MRIEGTFLQGKVGRRIFLMFGIAVIVPTVVVFWITYKQAADLAHENNVAAMRQENKHLAMSVFERLQMARHSFAEFADNHIEAKASTKSPMFTELRVEKPNTGFDFHSSNNSSDIGLAISSSGTQIPQLLFYKHKDGSQPDIVVVGVLSPQYLWGDPDAAISDGRICVSSGAVTLTCLGSISTSGSRDALVDSWTLFLEPEFGIAPWQFNAVQEKKGDLSQYVELLGPVALGMLLLALLLSSLAIRRTLVPLEALVKRIKAVAGDGRGAEDRQDDEFTVVGHAFSNMELRISEQIATLRTLQEVDQLILSHVPLEKVVQIVLSAISRHVGPHAIALSFSAYGSQPIRHFIRFADEDESREPAGDDPLDDAGRSWMAPSGTWLSTDALSRGFQDRHIQRAHYLILGPQGGPLVRAVVGSSNASDQEGPAYASESSEMVAEFVGRVAVAAAAEAHDDKLIYQARHDLLTSLPNRLAVLEEIDSLIRTSRESNAEFAVLFMDIDRFKSINDGLGHADGDLVLVEVSNRVRAALGAEAFLARLGGDEFLAVVPQTKGAPSALASDRAIRNTLKAPVTVGSSSLAINFSAGIALYPQDGLDSTSLLQNADIAMYRAKKSGGGAAVLFDASMNQVAAQRVQLEKDLRAAIKAGEINLHYQPRVDSRDLSIVGAEALVRWNHPSLGDLPPIEFIELAEECGLIVELGSYVIGAVCRQLSQWTEDGLAAPVIAINVSTFQLRSGDLFDTLADALAANNVAWNQIELEITESAFVRDAANASEQLTRLRNAGVTIAIDDFGTGYSSLAYLTALPTDTIKIDRAFAQHLHEQKTQAVVLSIIALAAALGKQVVAEGIETSDDVLRLKSWGCYVIQGYYYYRPMAPADFAKVFVESTLAIARR